MKTENKQLTIQTDSLLTSNKADIGTIVKQYVSDIQEGRVDPLQAFILVKKTESMVKDLLKEVKPIVDGLTIQKGGITMFNAEITETTQGAGWDYSETGDLVLEEMLAKQEQLKEDIKNRQAFLQTIKVPTDWLDNSSGEVYKIQPPIKSGALGKTVKLK